MRVAVFSDIHGNICALESVLRDIRSRAADSMIFLGDLVNGGPCPQEVFDRLDQVKPLVWLKGNSDAWFDEIDDRWKPKDDKEQKLFQYYQYAVSKLSPSSIDFLKKLSVNESVEIDGLRILCVHGSPRSVSERMDLPVEVLEEITKNIDEQVVVCGHTNVPFCIRVKSKVIINAGSVGYPLDMNPRACYAMMEIKQGNLISLELVRVAYDISRTIKLAKENGLPFVDEYESRLRIRW